MIWKVEDIRFEFCEQLFDQNFVEDKTGCKVIEIIGAQFIADESSIFGTVNYDYVKRELEWYNSQSLNVNDIPGKVPEIWKKVATPDGRINSNYGWCVWSEANHKQYDKCLRELICNRDSRRAIMIYTRPSMHEDFCVDGMSDFMCTNTVQYFVRNNMLHAHVSMRSNDVVHGYKNDFAWQRHVQEQLLTDYNRLTESKVALGHVIWNVGSLHVYERHFDLIRESDDFKKMSHW